ncbi:MAG: hypothetical protein HKN37_12930 [Rhodothermales bacterium]|nr:hypothetical protein [Rhodothermales bacterium]
MAKAEAEIEDNTGGDNKTLAAIAHTKTQIEMFSQGLINAEARRDRDVERGNASIAHMQKRLEAAQASLKALEG